MSATPQLSIDKNAKTELACGYTQRASRGKCNYNSAYQSLLNKSKGIILLAGIIATTERRKANEDIYVASGVYRKGCSASAKVRSLLVRVMKNSASAEAVQGYTAEELITKRAQVKNAIQLAIESFIDETLGQKEVLGAVSIANVAITDFDFSAEFNRAIEEKVRAEQEALKAINEKLRRVTQAEAAAAERTLAADAEAYQIEVASKARADAIRREAEALKDNPALIQLRIAEKWNGQLPQVSGGGAIPLLDLRALSPE